MWIPEADKTLKLRVLIAGHTGITGHRGWRTTKATVQAHFWWKGLARDVESFVKSCIHCLSTESGKVVPRPLGHAMHAEKPNELLHFDFCYLMPGEDSVTYVLILKDDLSGYVWLIPTADADAESVADALLKWFAAFGVVSNWVSDRGSHFKNELVRILGEATKASHHFTLAYCPWSNGTVEVVCRELLRATRALLSEFQLPHRCWPSVLPLVQSALNNSKIPRLGNRCPLTAFTGLPQDSPLACIKRKEGHVVQVQNFDEVQTRQAIAVERLQRAFESMHKDVAERSSKKRQAAVDSHNRKTGVRPIHFTEGDFVLRGLLQRERGRKPALRWKGPFRVTTCKSDYIFEVEDLITGRKQDVHGRRLKFFRNSAFEVTEEVRDHLAYQENELLVIESFDDLRRKNGDIELLVRWKGFGPEEVDWVSISTLKEDVPALLEEFLTDILKSGTARQRNIAAYI